MKEQFPINLSIVQCSARSRHDPDFAIDRPHGSGDYVLIHFASTIILNDLAGVRHHPRNTTILYTPGFRQYYTAAGPEMDHAWCHLSGASLPNFIKQLGIPVNTAMQLGSVDFFVPMINNVKREELRSEDGWQDLVAVFAAECLLRLRRAIIRHHHGNASRYQLELEDRFRAVREQVHNDLSRSWTVAGMAKIASVSQSHFAALYRQFFGCSPIDDLIEARVNQAAFMLKSTNFSIKQVGEICGFNSAQMFSIVFKQRKGVSPRSYREIE